MARPKARKNSKRTSQRPGVVLKERSELAAELANSPTMTVTLRIPSAFNEWLDAYRHLSYPERVGKQELVVEGLMMAYLRRGMPGEPILEADQVILRARSRA